MDWLMEPVNGFKAFDIYLGETCPVTWIQCSCTGGLLLCTGGGTLVKNPQPQ